MQLISLLRTPQTLKKSQINNVCAGKQSAVRPRDAIGGKKGLHSLWLVRSSWVSWRNTQRSLSLPYQLSYQLKYLLYFELISSLFLCNLIVENLILHIFRIIIIIIRCFGMFWNVPGCSGMFRVPGFIDGHSSRLSWKRSFAGIDKTRNMEHPGTSNII